VRKQPRRIGRTGAVPKFLRSNCVLLIKNYEHITCKNITIKKQDANENIIIANSISPVNSDTIISNIINISEDPFVIDELTTQHIGKHTSKRS